MNPKSKIALLLLCIFAKPTLQASEKLEYYTAKEKLEVAGFTAFGGVGGGSIGASAGMMVGASLGALVAGPAGMLAGCKAGGILGGAIGAGGGGFLAGDDVAEGIKRCQGEIPKKITFEKIITQPSWKQWEAYKLFRDGKEPLVIVRNPFSFSQDAENNKNEIEAQLLPLRQAFGRPVYGGQFVALSNQTYAQDLANTIANPKNGSAGNNIQTYINRLSQNPELFALLRRQAVLSFAAPQDEIFADLLKNVIAHVALLEMKANHHPVYERLLIAQESLRNEQAAKEAAQADYTAAQNNFVAERVVRNEIQIDFNAERVIRNQLQIDLNAERADKARIQERNRLTLAEAIQQSCDIEEQRADLEDRAQRLNGALAQAVEQSCDIESQRSDLEEAVQVAANREQRLNGALVQAAQQSCDIEEQRADLEDRAQRLNGTLAQAVEQSCDIEEQRFDLEKENGTLRQQLSALQQQLADSQRIIRRQSKNNRRTVNKLHVLERLHQRNGKS